VYERDKTEIDPMRRAGAGKVLVNAHVRSQSSVSARDPQQFAQEVGKLLAEELAQMNVAVS
jgi:hypothetical protein